MQKNIDNFILGWGDPVWYPVMTNSALTISIVTPSLNQGEYIEETIISVLSQRGDFFIDYLVMDGGSTDGSVELITKYERLVRSGDWNVGCRGIRFRWTSRKDAGQSDALNKGFALAEGNILGWLNSDDVYYPGALQSVCRLDWRKTDFCFGKGMWISRSGRDLCYYPTWQPNKYALYLQCTLCQPAVFFRKDVQRALGNLSLDYFCAFDYEFWVRAVLENKRFAFIPKLLAQSRMYPQNKSLSGQETVRDEIVSIKRKHYRDVNLNPVMKLVYGVFVNRFTNRQGRFLTAGLQAEENTKQ